MSSPAGERVESIGISLTANRVDVPEHLIADSNHVRADLTFEFARPNRSPGPELQVFYVSILNAMFPPR
jgi:hypothetical protein